MRLVRAEVSRWLARRAMWGTMAAGLVVVALLSAVMVLAARPPSGAEVENGRRVYREVHAEWLASSQTQYESCMATSPGGDKDCAFALIEPKESDFVPQPLSYAEGLKSGAEAGAVLGALLALVMGASFWGAEYRNGSLATWLTFVSGRNRVWASKFAVLALAGVLVTALCQAVPMVAVSAGVAVLQGVGAQPGPLADALALAGRGLGLGALFAIFGGALAVLFRQTLAPVLVPIGYFLAQMFVGLLAMIPGFNQLGRWLPENNIRAYLENGVVYFEQVFRVTPDGLQVDAVERTLPFVDGLVYLLVLVGLVAVGSLVAFRRRDVE